MSKKIDRAMRGPSWAEVILGAVLAVALGVVLGAALLILRPVVVAKEMPKDPDRKAVYYIEGSRDTAKAKQALAKRKAFVEGQSVTVTEDELNALASPASAPAPAGKAPEKKADPKAKAGDKAPAPAPGETVAIGATNFRIDNGLLQVGVPVTINALGLDQKVIVQARGGFEKRGEVFVFEPSELYFGSCPVQRLPFLADYVRNKALEAQPLPEDIKAAWPKLAGVTIEKNALKLTMP